MTRSSGVALSDTPVQLARVPDDRAARAPRRRCWEGFVLTGQCTQTTDRKCLLVGRDISEHDARQYPKGDVKTQQPPQAGR